MYTQEALINLLVKKGIISKDEVLEEIKRLKKNIVSSEERSSPPAHDFNEMGTKWLKEAFII
jgi:hypothetical protein